MARGRKPGGPKTGGRQPGTPNKFPEEVRVAVMKAFDKLGGAKYLEMTGRTRPELFITLLAKILPHELATSGGGIRHEVLLKWMTPEIAKARGLIMPTEEDSGAG